MLKAFLGTLRICDLLVPFYIYNFTEKYMYIISYAVQYGFGYLWEQDEEIIAIIFKKIMTLCIQ